MGVACEEEKDNAEALRSQRIAENIQYTDCEADHRVLISLRDL
jgi:hypothetical protein